jgi:hypothetical protein
MTQLIDVNRPPSTTYYDPGSSSETAEEQDFPQQAFWIGCFGEKENNFGSPHRQSRRIQ